MEKNFSLFFGLPIHFSGTVLASDARLFDRVARGHASRTAEQQGG